MKHCQPDAADSVRSSLYRASIASNLLDRTSTLDGVSTLLDAVSSTTVDDDCCTVDASSHIGVPTCADDGTSPLSAISSTSDYPLIIERPTPRITDYHRPRAMTPPAVPSRRISLNSVPPPPPPSTTSGGFGRLSDMVVMTERDELLRRSADVWLRRSEIEARQLASIQSSSQDTSSTRSVKILDDRTVYYSGCQYVRFKKSESAVNLPHDYSYPNLPIPMAPDQQRGCVGLSRELMMPPPLPKKSTDGQGGWLSRWRRHRAKKSRSRRSSQRFRCTDCEMVFSPDTNHRGSCPDGPDNAAQCIEFVSCLSCAQGVVYHCATDDEERDEAHVCSCNGSGSCRRWTVLILLSLVLPCLLCYLPLKACHRCAVDVGCCGARHRVVN